MERIRALEPEKSGPVTSSTTTLGVRGQQLNLCVSQSPSIEKEGQCYPQLRMTVCISPVPTAQEPHREFQSLMYSQQIICFQILTY